MITSVKLGNFLSHKDTELTFDNGVTVSLVIRVQANPVL